jgi:hypothetical protein
MAAAVSIQAVGVTVYNLETARPSFSFSLANGQRLAAPCTWCATTRTFYAATKEVSLGGGCDLLIPTPSPAPARIS